MSREAAAKELTKEIEWLTGEAQRLTKLRDEILKGSGTFSPSTVPATAAKRAAKKGAASAKKTRVLSPEGKRKIIEANKRRWAQKRKVDAAATKTK
jgi:hypothetical protein